MTVHYLAQRSDPQVSIAWTPSDCEQQKLHQTNSILLFHLQKFQTWGGGRSESIGRLSSIFWNDTVWVSTPSLQKSWRCSLVPPVLMADDAGAQNHCQRREVTTHPRIVWHDAQFVGNHHLRVIDGDLDHAMVLLSGCEIWQQFQLKQKHACLAHVPNGYARHGKLLSRGRKSHFNQLTHHFWLFPPTKINRIFLPKFGWLVGCLSARSSMYQVLKLSKMIHSKISDLILEVMDKIWQSNHFGTFKSLKHSIKCMG